MIEFHIDIRVVLKTVLHTDLTLRTLDTLRLNLVQGSMKKGWTPNSDNR